MSLPAAPVAPAIRRRPAGMSRRVACGNRLIDALPRSARARLLAAGKRVDLRPGLVLCEPGQRIRHAWFPLEGFLGLSTHPSHPARMEVDLVGNEGMLGAALVLGVAEASQRALVLGAGVALRIDAATLRRELQRVRALRRLLNRYVYVLMMQFLQNSTCVASHKIEQRLARLLLMSQDRARAEALNITQASLAEMLGVRRVGVTEAAGALQRLGYIRYSRGRVAVTDRAGLERAACGCYRAVRASHQRWLG
ncbi:MAG TPA: Crp/Fnr family transcriptional regulator [Rhodanobacteraceae bacterium]|nr:Crp/Fnr family transcriptional regulator [Rhodanobacteraceae bacterium]